MIDRTDPVWTAAYAAAFVTWYAERRCSTEECVAQAKCVADMAIVGLGEARRPDVYAFEDWTEDDGNVLWWKFPVVEPPYVGEPLDDEFPDYVTHWTRIQIPKDGAR